MQSYNYSNTLILVTEDRYLYFSRSLDAMLKIGAIKMRIIVFAGSFAENEITTFLYVFRPHGKWITRDERELKIAWKPRNFCGVRSVNLVRDTCSKPSIPSRSWFRVISFAIIASPRILFFGQGYSVGKQIVFAVARGARERVA